MGRPTTRAGRALDAELSLPGRPARRDYGPDILAAEVESYEVGIGDGIAMAPPVTVHEMAGALLRSGLIDRYQGYFHKAHPDAERVTPEEVAHGWAESVCAALRGAGDGR